MNCTVCGQQVENSEELQKHMEGAHPTGGAELEKPDLLDTSAESAASQIRQPTD